MAGMSAAREKREAEATSRVDCPTCGQARGNGCRNTRYGFRPTKHPHPRRLALWAATPRHRIYDIHLSPAMVYHALCTCGWASHGENIRAFAATDGERHVADGGS
jgi:hypothetical protein